MFDWLEVCTVEGSVSETNLATSALLAGEGTLRWSALPQPIWEQLDNEIAAMFVPGDAAQLSALVPVAGGALVASLPVVMVQVGATWGTGILLRRGVVLTCSHVVKFDRTARGAWTVVRSVRAICGVFFCSRSFSFSVRFAMTRSL